MGDEREGQQGGKRRASLGEGEEAGSKSIKEVGGHGRKKGKIVRISPNEAGR
jgi:hypothetical protein